MSYYYIQSLDPAEMATRFSTEDVIEPIHGQDEEWKTPRLDKIRSVIEHLPPRERDLIQLYYFTDKKQTDIADIFGITQAAVSYRLKRALDRIKFLVELPEMTQEEVESLLVEIMPTELDAKIFAEMYLTTCQSEVALRLEETQGRVRHRFIKSLRYFGMYVLDQMYVWTDSLDMDSFEAKEARIKLDEVRKRENELTIPQMEEELVKLVAYIEELPPEIHSVKFMQIIRMYKVFVNIRYNFNILREVKLPKWSNRATNTIS